MEKNEVAEMTIDEFVGASNRIISEVSKAIVGKEEALRLMLAAFLCSAGHTLVEDYPGLAKTLMANSFARALGLSFARVQFTPDLLPGDITGGYIFDSQKSAFSLRKGPIFTNILLADEINRASPRTQSALLEAMQEYQVTLEGESLALPTPFIVVATQNPIEYEGTFPLPEAQLDRFIARIRLGYPTEAEEREILMRRRQRRQDEVELRAVVTPTLFSTMRQMVEEIYLDPDVEAYIVEIVSQTRRQSQVAVGCSPRGSIAILKLTRAWAALQGRTFVTPDDVKYIAPAALAHRLILEPKLWGSKTTEESMIRQILQTVEVPVLTSEYE